MLRDVIIDRDKVLQTMFPYKMKVSYTRAFIDKSLPLYEQAVEEKTYLLGEVPCSVQVDRTQTTPGNVYTYTILSPCIDMTPKTSISSDEECEDEYYDLEIEMNGKINTASADDILCIDNMEVFQLKGYAIGCKIIVQKGAKWTW